jgi:hypothetical protein
MSDNEPTPTADDTEGHTALAHEGEDTAGHTALAREDDVQGHGLSNTGPVEEPESPGDAPGFRT